MTYCKLTIKPYSSFYLNTKEKRIILSIKDVPLLVLKNEQALKKNITALKINKFFIPVI